MVEKDVRYQNLNRQNIKRSRPGEVQLEVRMQHYTNSIPFNDIVSKKQEVSQRQGQLKSKLKSACKTLQKFKISMT